MVVLDQARRGHEGLGIFGVDPALDGVTGDLDVFLLDRQRVARGDAEHLLDDVDAGDHLGHRMLHLHAGVHLDEVEATVFVEELEGAGAAVADVDAGLDAARQDFFAGLLVDLGRRRLLNDLLVTALQRAVAVIEVHGVALAIGEHLDFHVTRIAEELLHVDHGVAKGGAGFGLGQLDRLDQLGLVLDHAHAATTTATGGLDDHRIADFAADAQALGLVIRQGAVGARHGGDTGLLHGVLGGHLVAHQANHVGGGADEGESGLLHLLGEVGVLGEKAVAGVDGGGAGDFRGTDDGRDVQVGLGRGGRADAHRFVGEGQMHQFAVGGGMNRHRLDAQLLAGTHHAQGDFPAVGDQDFFQHRGLHGLRQW